MKPISKKSKEIIKHIENGKTTYWLIKNGYPQGTVMYYWIKIKNPRKFAIRLKKLYKYQAKRRLMHK